MALQGAFLTWRYMMAIVTMLMVAPALYFGASGARWLKVACLVVFENLPRNKDNIELVLSSSRLVKTERVVDRKHGAGVTLLLYILEYRGPDAARVIG